MRVGTLLAVLLLALSACSRTALLSVPPPNEVTVTLTADGDTRSLTTSAATVADALAEANIHLGNLDRVEPGEYLALHEGMVISVIRVIEQFHAEQAETAYGKQLVRSEGLPEGESRLLQAGRPGLEEIVYRIEYHDGVEVSRRVARRIVLEAAADEIVMVGSRGTVSPAPIRGTLAYISGGNGVVMRVSSANRDTVTSSGDLDGRVFSLAPDGRRLLYDWSPNGEQIAYSTASPISQPPGWEANNDLWLGEWNEEGRFQSNQLLEPSSGGIYGWWGASHAWSPDGRYLAYGQADEVGYIDVTTTRRVPLAEYSVFHTYADWVWTPIPTWSPDSLFVAAVVHGSPVGPEAAEDSQVFDLWQWEIDGWVAARLAARTGMWAFPVWSPMHQVGKESASQIAFLQATDPSKSATARYTLAVMDRDGSDFRSLFPPAGEIGLRPQPVAWSPGGDQIALIYNSNLYLVATADGSARPLTGDGINSNPTWTSGETAQQQSMPGLDMTGFQPR